MKLLSDLVFGPMAAQAGIVIKLFEVNPLLKTMATLRPSTPGVTLFPNFLNLCRMVLTEVFAGGGYFFAIVLLPSYKIFFVLPVPLAAVCDLFVSVFRIPFSIYSFSLLFVSLSVSFLLSSYPVFIF
jgi:hypothetical protein